jgi:hypothetical protein
MGPAEIGAVVKYGDWRKVGEVEVPMHVEYRYASQVVGTFHARYERVERVAELAPDTFRLTAR